MVFKDWNYGTKLWDFPIVIYSHSTTITMVILFLNTEDSSSVELLYITTAKSVMTLVPGTYSKSVNLAQHYKKFYCGNILSFHITPVILCYKTILL